MLIVQLAECKLILYNIVRIPGKSRLYIFPVEMTGLQSLANINFTPISVQLLSLTASFTFILSFPGEEHLLLNTNLRNPYDT